MIPLRNLIISVGMAMVIGCAVNPVTGERELSLVSTNEEIAIGKQQYGPSQQTQGGQYTVDPALQSYVSEVGKRLAVVSDAPDLPYEFVVLNNSVPNAWALPGGKIAVNRGLLVELDDEAELAAVLGHEIVHAAARHSASQMSRGMLVGLTAQVATIAAASQGYGELGNAASQLGGAAFMATYGRNDELEADKYGMKYMAELGYSAEAAVTLQETFVRLSKGQESDFISGLFASHPPSQERVDANRKRAAQLPEGRRYRERYQRHIKQLKIDAPAYEAEAQALAALKKEDPKAALALLDRAIELQPAEAQFWEMRGHAWDMLGNSENAEKAYTTAINKNPALFSPPLYRGLLRYRQKELSGARSDIARSRELLPTAISALILGDIYLQQGENKQATSYLQEAMKGGNEQIANAAYNRLARLELSEHPHKYIVSKPFLGSDGYLRIALRNNTNIPVRRVQLQFAQMTSSQTVGAVQTVRGRFKLAAGQQLEVATGVGPLQNATQVRSFRTRVVHAEAVD